MTEKLISWKELKPGQTFRFSITQDVDKGEYPYITVGIYDKEDFIFWKMNLAWERENGYDTAYVLSDWQIYEFKSRDKVYVKDDQAQDD